MVVADSSRSGQQWHPITSQYTINADRTSLSGGRRPVAPKDVKLSRPMLTPDDAYFFQKQQRGRPQAAPRVPTKLGPRPMTVPDALPTRSAATVAAASDSRQRLHASSGPEEAERLHDELSALRLLMRGYDETPSLSLPGGRGGESLRPSSRGSPRLAEYADVSVDANKWQRPSSSAASSGRSLSARTGGPSRFAFRESMPRTGQSSLSELPSRRPFPFDATPQQRRRNAASAST